MSCGPAAAPDAGALQRPPGVVEVLRPALDPIEPAFARHLRRLHAEAERQLAVPGAAPSSLAAAFGRLGQHYAAFGFLVAAEAALHNAEAMAPGEYRWPYLRGLVAYDHGDLDAAVGCFQRALALRPNDAAAALHLGTLYLELGRRPLARRWLRRALELDPGSASAHHRLGQLAALDGDHRAAIESFETALELQPEASAVHYALGLSFRRLGDLEQARAHLERRGERQADARDSLLAELGDIVHLTAFEAITAEVAAGDDFAAEDTLEFTRRYLGDLEGNVEEIERFLRDLKGRSGAVSPVVEARFHYLLAGLLAERGEVDRTIEHLRSAVALAGDFVEARLMLANALGRGARHEEALVHYSAVLASDPGQLGARGRRATTYVHLGRFEEAIRDLTAALELAPGDPDNRLRLAVARLMAGDLAGFERERRALLALELPAADRERLHLVLGASLTTAGRHGDAAREYRAVLRQRPGSFDANLALARLEGHLGRYEEARLLYRRALDAEPLDPEARRGEITALLLLGRRTEARSRFEAATRDLPADLGLDHALARLLAAP